LPRRLREARFTVSFCRAVYAHLTPSDICSAAAAQLDDYFHYRLAIFSFSRESALDSLAYVPTLGSGGARELQRLVLDALHTTSETVGTSRLSTGILGAEINLMLPGGMGQLRLYQVEGDAHRHTRSFLAGIAECLATALAKAREHNDLRDLALRDAMTGLFNRRAFEELLALEMGRRGDHPLSLLMVDIDNFKAINDRYGHPAGDEVIRAIGDAIGAECRGSDLAARYGGEEFAVLLPGAEVDNAVAVAERIRSRIAALDFSFGFDDFTVTGSFGVACKRLPHGSTRDLVHEADRALYAAKRSGKNRVLVHEEQLRE
jgi:diguanylate cyclase (GGDEF)-like protein